MRARRLAIRAVTPAPVVGISACLFGCPVRYDGEAFDVLDAIGADRSRFVFVPVCPEVMAGFGVPRPPIHLTGSGDEVLDGLARVIDAEGRDVTEALLAGVTACAEALDRAGARAVILKERSPSCGLAEARILSPDGGERRGAGVFAALMRRSGRFVLTELEASEPELWRTCVARCTGGAG